MDKRKQKKIKRGAAALQKLPNICRNCGVHGNHFVPPCFGEAGFYICEPKKAQP